MALRAGDDRRDPESLVEDFCFQPVGDEFPLAGPFRDSGLDPPLGQPYLEFTEDLRGDFELVGHLVIPEIFGRKTGE